MMQADTELSDKNSTPFFRFEVYSVQELVLLHVQLKEMWSEDL
jgi:hypothetical protein